MISALGLWPKVYSLEVISCEAMIEIPERIKNSKHPKIKYVRQFAHYRKKEMKRLEGSSSLLSYDCTSSNYWDC